MKKVTLIILAIIGLGVLFSCKEEPKDPVLDISQTSKQALISPADGSVFVLAKDSADNIFAEFQWSEVVYNLTDLEATNYILQMDVADSNFVNAIDLINTTGTSYTLITIGAMNQKLLGMGLSVGEPHNIEFRVLAYINTDSDYSNVYSDVITLNVTPYSDEVYIKPIYLLGSATTVGWSNTDALEMTSIGGGQFSIVETLTPGAGQYIKFISVLGLWAPQWGTDATGTSESGPLVYRPDEATTDPPAIPAPATAGDYLIVADTALLNYTVSATSAQLFLIGDATLAGWDNKFSVQFTKLKPGIFSLVTTLNKSGSMKFVEASGFAQNWGTDASGTSDQGKLIYDQGIGAPESINIPAPSTSGSYRIELNLITQTYKITPQ